VPASRGIAEKPLREIEPFPTTTDLKPYNPGFLSGWVVEQYQIDLVAAAQNSRDIMEGKTRTLCSAEVPGDTQRSLDVASTFSGQTFKTHSRSHLAHRLHLRRQDFSSRGQWVHGFDCRASSVELDQNHTGRSSSARGPDYRTGDLPAFEIVAAMERWSVGALCKISNSRRKALCDRPALVTIPLKRKVAAV
jgi:hypothetical protein